MDDEEIYKAAKAAWHNSIHKGKEYAFDDAIIKTIIEARADEWAKWQNKLQDERKFSHEDVKEAYAKGYAQAESDGINKEAEVYNFGIKKGQADLIEKLTDEKTVAGLARYWYDCLITGDEGDAFIVFKNNPDIEKLQKENATFILHALTKKASESVALRGNKPPISAEISGSLGANATSGARIENPQGGASRGKPEDIGETPISPANPKPENAYDESEGYDKPEIQKSCGTSVPPTSCGKLKEPRLDLCKKCWQMTNHSYNEETGELICLKCKSDDCKHEWGDGHTPDGKKHWQSCVKCGKPKGETMNRCAKCNICLDDLCGNCRSRMFKHIMNDNFGAARARK